MKKILAVTIMLVLAALTGFMFFRGGVLIAGDSKTGDRADRDQQVNDMAEKEMTDMKKAIFGAGCFWGVEAVFREIEGVVSTRVGFAGGKTENPTYQEVCYENTGHAEVVEVTYDPSVVGYDKLLAVFWAMHDPTALNRQGPDIGDQYRSAIFYLDEDQKETALESRKELDASGKYKRPIVTEITQAGPFYEAEEYHQQYYEKKGVSPACHYIPEGLLKAKKD